MQVKKTGHWFVGDDNKQGTLKILDIPEDIVSIGNVI